MGAGIGPRRCRAAEQRDELTAFELVELHSISTSQRRMQDIELHLFHSNISVPFEYCYCPTSGGRTGNVSSAAETFRLGPRGRGPHNGRRGLRDGACGNAFRHGAKGKRKRAAPRRHQARSAARHSTRLAPVLHQRTLRPCRAHLRQIIPRTRPRPCVAYPRNEADVKAVLDWAGGADATVTPFGGGSSVCGGVEPKRNGHKGAVTIDLRQMDKVKEVDKTSRAALIEGGTYGPALEAQLRPHGLTLRHFPQSFEYSTLGGWIATRGGGHFATLYTHIDDFVESLRTVTPRGVIESRRLPGSGAGPSPDRLMIGSEGILGIITQSWMRLQDRPKFRDGGAVRFKDFFSAARAVRA